MSEETHDRAAAEEIALRLNQALSATGHEDLAIVGIQEVAVGGTVPDDWETVLCAGGCGRSGRVPAGAIGAGMQITCQACAASIVADIL